TKSPCAGVNVHFLPGPWQLTRGSKVLLGPWYLVCSGIPIGYPQVAARANHPISAQPLGFIKAFVHLSQNAFEIQPVRGPASDATAYREPVRLPRDRDGHHSELFAEFVDPLDRALDVHARERDHELLTAEACHQVACSDGTTQAHSKQLQCLVTGEVSVRVVELLELVHVQQRNAES